MNKKLFIFVILIIFIAISIFLISRLLYLKLTKENKKPINNISSFEECASAGHVVLTSPSLQCITSDGKKFTKNINNELEKFNSINIENPQPNQIIENPLLIKGKARGYWFFEGSFPVKLFDENGFLLGESSAKALGDWMTENFVDFETVLHFAFPSSPKGKLILEKDNPSGLPENSDQLSIPVYFKEISKVSKDLMTVKIFLSNSRFVNEPYFDCSQTIAVERKIPKNSGVAKATIEALLRGATQKEIDQGFISNINPGVRVQKLIIENGIAKVDFNNQLEFKVGGSCRITAIRSQIIETLKQFPTIKEIIISIEGKTKNILQP